MLSGLTKPFKQCQRLNLSLWECPSFLFVLMGAVTIIAMLGTYFVARLYTSTEIVIVAVTMVTTICFIIGNFVVRSVDRLVEANEMKTEFVSIASHQLRTPLSALKWGIEAIKDTSLRKKQTQYLNILEENNQRMIRLVNTLLNVTRIEQGRFNLHKEKINLNNIIKQRIKEFKFIAQNNNTKLIFSSDKNIKQITADEQKISMVITNLLSNALQYIKKSGQVKITTKNKKDNVLIKIKDNGVGIPEDEQDQIFQKFFRAKNAKRYKTQGSGLGLYIAKSIINAHQGKIWFKSKPDKGTIFYIKLPYKNDN